MPNALITGGAGFIGSHLTDFLRKQNYHVTILDNLSTGRIENIAHLDSDPLVQVVIEDMRNTMVVDRLVSECDIIFHLAAAVGVQKILQEPINTIETNIGGTEVLLKAARRYRKKILIASTSEVYGKGVKIPFAEEDDVQLGTTTKNRWSYAFTKAIDEFLALAYHQETGLPVVLFRLFNTVGPRQSGQYGMVLPRFVQRAMSGEPIQVYGDGQQTRCFGNVYDAVNAIYRLSTIDEAIGEVFNIGSTEEISIYQLAEQVKQQAQSASEIQIISYEEAYQSNDFEDFRRRVPSVDKIGRVVGWEPTTPLTQTIDQIIAYYSGEQKNG